MCEESHNFRSLRKCLGYVRSFALFFNLCVDTHHFPLPAPSPVPTDVQGRQCRLRLRRIASFATRPPPVRFDHARALRTVFFLGNQAEPISWSPPWPSQIAPAHQKTPPSPSPSPCCRPAAHVLHYRDLEVVTGYTERHIRRLVRQGDFPPPDKIDGGHMLARPVETVEAWLASKEVV